MRIKLLVVASAFLVLGLAGSATAGTSYYSGTVKITIGDLEPAYVTGTGVATLNGGAGGTHVTTITLGTATPASGISGATIIPVTDPEGIADNGIISVRITFTAGGGALGPILAGSSASTIIPMTAAGNKLGSKGGLVRLCLFVPGCGLNLPLALVGTKTLSGLTTGAGVGGQLTIGGSGSLRISIDARPWTILTGTAIDQPDIVPNTSTGLTFSGGAGTVNSHFFTLVTAKGFAHGPASAVSSVALGNGTAYGVIQLVTPSQTTTNITSTSSVRIGNPTVGHYRFVPEPGMMLLIVSGAAGMAVLGRRRMKK
jgi:hypothetical protein